MGSSPVVGSIMTEPKMFDDKGTCKYCRKSTRAKSTSLCNACYKLDLAIKNNPSAAKRILELYLDRKIERH